MTGTTPSWDSASAGGAGEHASCPDCGCAVTITHRGETEARDAAPFICHCGTPMQPEPADAAAGAGDAGDVRSEDDLLAQGGGAGAATGMGRTSSTSSSPGGG